MNLFADIMMPELIENESEEWKEELPDPDLVCPKCGAGEDDIVTQMEGAGDDVHEMLACTECGYTW
jgi:DNA-directed RNA polymerase subunit M/transcription elongation factor TFIIS